ncbi:MAG: ubiquitin-like domain-containing protein [Sporichthyaceae bacterium]|nr:ubiquitin-like domain-containing protein [Sporichthyaceae bacterium]
MRFPLKLALQITVMTGLVGGTTAFVSLDKTVVLSVDGEARLVHSFATTVRGVLDAHDIRVGSHDVVGPGLASQVADGTHISIRYGREVTVTVNGERRQVWMTATNVAEALEQLKVRDENAFVSVSRSAPIGREGLEFQVRLPRRISVTVEKEDPIKFVTTAGTVGEALLEAGVAVSEKDYVTPAFDSFPKEGAKIRVYRITGKVESRNEVIHRKVKRVNDSSIYEGLVKVSKSGRDGTAEVTYEYVQKDGKWVIKRELSRTTVKRPVDRVIRVGTGSWPKTGAEHLNWEALADCESTGNPRAVNPNGHYGLYQFSLSTWASVGGTGNPIDAHPAEQTYRAQVLYMRAGAGQWTCGSRLFS